MLKALCALTLLVQTCLIGFSGHLLMTGETDLPGFHFSLIFLNAAFGAVNVYNLIRA